MVVQNNRNPRNNLHCFYPVNMSDKYLQRLAKQFGSVSFDIVVDNARAPSTTVTRKPERPVRRQRRRNSSDGVRKTGHSSKQKGVRRQNTYPSSRWEPSCPKDTVPSLMHMSLRSLSSRSLTVDSAMKAPRRSVSPVRSKKSTIEILNDVLSELSVFDRLVV